MTEMKSTPEDSPPGPLFDIRIDTKDIASERLKRLLAYWNAKRGDRAMPARRDIAPEEMREHLGRLDLLDVEAPATFRYRLHGSITAYRDRRNMTGMTTGEYTDTAFGDMLTRHLRECVDTATPAYRHFVAQQGDEHWEYFRLVLPLSEDGTHVNMLLVSSLRSAKPLASAPPVPAETTPMAKPCGGP